MEKVICGGDEKGVLGEIGLLGEIGDGVKGVFFDLVNERKIIGVWGGI